MIPYFSTWGVPSGFVVHSDVCRDYLLSSLGVVLLRSGNMNGLMHPELPSGGGGDKVKTVRRPGWGNAEWRKSDSELEMCSHPL